MKKQEEKCKWYYAYLKDEVLSPPVYLPTALCRMTRQFK
jgi:hypothetical protein